MSLNVRKHTFWHVPPTKTQISLRSLHTLISLHCLHGKCLHSGLSNMVGCSQPWWLSWMRVQLVIRRFRVRPPPGWQHPFMEIDHEILSRVILSLLLIQEGQLSVSGERMCTILISCLDDKASTIKLWLGKLTVLDMTPLGWLGRKTSKQSISLMRVRMVIRRLQDPHPAWSALQHSFVEIDHEIFSAVILSFPLIQEGQLSVSAERICIILVNGLED